MSSPISGGGGASAGTPDWNKHLMTPQPNVERTHATRDPGVQGMDGYPGMYDLAKSLTAGKWGNSPKT